MQLMTGDRQVVTEGVEDSTSFGFDPEDLPFIKRILRDSIYSDKHLAPIREYSANAWDAHRMAGKADLPIKVRVPTWDDPRLLIEDYGPGLSHKQVFSTYAKYGRSTKRGTNNAVGMLGIGSKSAFCYSDTFVITSRYGGQKRVYVAKLNMDGNDSLDLLSTTDWTVDTGITIEIAVRREDIKSFEAKARELFKYFNPRPDINIKLPPVPRVRSQLKHGLIYEKDQYGMQDTSNGEWLALMGCIPYVVDLGQLKDQDGKSTVSHIFLRCAGILDFDVGTVQISSSREALEYSKSTKEALARKFEELLDEYTKFVLDEIDKGCTTNWERRLKSRRLLHLGMTEKEIGGLAKSSVFPKAKTFQFSQDIQPLSETKLIREIIPEGKDLRGYHLYGGTDVLIRPKMVEKFNEALKYMETVEPVQYYTWPEIDAELEQVLRDNMLDGVPFGKLEDMDWQAPYHSPVKKRTTRSSGPKEEKHVKRIFKLTGWESYQGKKYSDNWEVLDHAPRPTDVYVIIEGFVPKDLDTSFFDIRKRDAVLAQTFGVTLPDVYGYKSTESKPVDLSKIVGIPYSKWRNMWHKELVQSEDIKLAQEFFDWRDSPCPRYKGKPKYTQLVMANLAREFGEDHQVLEFLRSAAWARDIYPDDMQEWRKRINALDAEGILRNGVVSEPDRIMREITMKYPLMSGNGLSVLWGKMGALHWRQYIRCIDREAKSAVQPQPEFCI